MRNFTHSFFLDSSLRVVYLVMFGEVLFAISPHAHMQCTTTTLTLGHIDRSKPHSLFGEIFGEEGSDAFVEKVQVARSKVVLRHFIVVLYAII